MSFKKKKKLCVNVSKSYKPLKLYYIEYIVKQKYYSNNFALIFSHPIPKVYLCACCIRKNNENHTCLKNKKKLLKSNKGTPLTNLYS